MLLKDFASSCEILGMSGDEVEMIDNVQLLVSLSKHSEFFSAPCLAK